MSTTTIQQNILYGLGEGASVADATFLEYALRWANASYREIMLRYRFKTLRTRSIFRTSDGQQTYQAPSDFLGFLVLKDESSGNVLSQVTPEEFAREVDSTTVTNETFTADDGVAVALDYQGIVQYSETVQNTDEDTTYTRDTDYEMAYPAGTITVDDAESMSDATDYYIDYECYANDGKPKRFCIEYDATNTRYVFRLDPIPDATYIASILYSALPTELSGSVDTVWSQFEFALERGGIYFGSMELELDPQKRMELKNIYEVATQALIQLDLELVPKRNTIPVVMRQSEYTNANT